MAIKSSSIALILNVISSLIENIITRPLQKEIGKNCFFTRLVTTPTHTKYGGDVNLNGCVCLMSHFTLKHPVVKVTAVYVRKKGMECE